MDHEHINLPSEEDINHSHAFFTALGNRSIIPLTIKSELVSVPSDGTVGSTLRRLPINVPGLPNPDNVQGDIIYQFPKDAEAFLFFRISSVPHFRTALATFNPAHGEHVFQSLHAIHGHKLRNAPRGERVELVHRQIAFTRAGLNLLGLVEKIGDERFDKFCMRDNKTYLGDGMPWDEIFDKPNYDPINGTANVDAGAIHCVVSIAANDVTACQRAIEAFKNDFAGAVDPEQITVVQGKSRPDDQRGHEHFGFMDGISQPAMRGIIAPKPGQIQVDPGVIITGYKGDPMREKRPTWAKDGTFMVFRKLQQLVPEFDKYRNDNGPRWKEFVPKIPEGVKLTDEEGTQLWGARMIGRWPSGAPLALAPYFDDPKLAKDPQRNNDFDYSVPDVQGLTEVRCPFVAHTRKTVPRNLDPFLAKKFLESGSILRAGLPFGDEVSNEERKKQESDPDPKKWRGLCFVCYQSDLDSGFVHQTVQFANNDYAPTVSFIPQVHGQDPILGGPPHPLNEPTTIVEQRAVKSGDQVNLQLTNEAGDQLEVNGFATVAIHGALPPPGVPQQFFVNSRGGEYFFVPSISTLKLIASGN